MISVKLGLLLLLASYISAFGLKEFCYSDEDCDGGKCVSHFMKLSRCFPSGTCYFDEECNPGEKCVKHQYAGLGTCEKPPKWCLDDKNCDESEACVRKSQSCPTCPPNLGQVNENDYIDVIL